MRPERVRLTYRELDARAEAIARAVRPLAGPDQIVAILLPRDAADLYAAQLAVLRAGAAFTCIAPAFPDEHLAEVLTDAGAVAILTDKRGWRRCSQAALKTPPLIDVASLAEPSKSEPTPTLTGANLAYVIYTSGTTGRPKGVLVEHRSVVNLIEGDVAYFDLDQEDRIAHCSSPAYDSSIEETWMAFSVGAALVLLDDETVRLGPDLVPWLAREKISVLCPTPTLLRTTGCVDPKSALPMLKLLYVGGEPLPRDIADRWAAGRWMENGYGPTECTVTVVRSRVLPGAPVTIGRPIAGAEAYVLDDALSPVAEGEPGELCIAGRALARGYNNRAELTRERFIAHPQLGRIYRTGDLVWRNAAGELEHLGRIDAQVKLRGYRIELGAIEAVLTAQDGVQAAACTLQGEGRAQVLAAHLIPDIGGARPDVDTLKAAVRRALPAYMVPARFAFREALPTTAGGKLDRNALPEISSASRDQRRQIVAPRNAAERKVVEAFQRALGLSDDISIHDDFFADLGGDSLTAVEVICDLRGPASGIAVRDLYFSRTASALAAQPERRDPASSAARLSEVRPTGRPIASSVVQSLWIVCELVVGNALAWGLALLMLAMLRSGGTKGALLASAVGVLAILAYLPFSIAVAVLLKRLLIGRYQATTQPVWGSFFTRHWIVTSAAKLIPWALLAGTPFAATALRALGAKIGKRVHIHRGVNLHGGWDLLTIGDDVTLAQGVVLRLADFEDGQLVVGPINLGDRVTIDVGAGLDPHTVVENEGYLAPLSGLMVGSRIKAGERWDGVPAEPAGLAPPIERPTGGAGFPPLIHGGLALGASLVSAIAIALTPLLAILAAAVAAPGVSAGLNDWLGDPEVPLGALAISCLIASGGLVAGLVAMALSARLMGPVRPGVYGQYSPQALRIWTKTQIVDSAGRWLSGSMFWVWWLRMAGMTLGPDCEISTIIDVLPETVSIGGGSFFADGIYFCAPWRHRGTITVGQSTLGKRTFLGNHALVPAGDDWPDDLFIGVSTVADPRLARPDTAWFGHPPMELPRREVVKADRSLTHEPDPLRVATRTFWELLRFGLPWLPIVVAYGWYLAMHAASQSLPWPAMVLVVAPLLTAISTAAICLVIVAMKWVLLGRMKPGQHAFWSCWCGRWDFLFMAWNLLARPGLGLVEGTLLLNAFLRLTGVKLGKRVILGYGFSQVVDPDMLSFADDSTVSCQLQAHSFEDRILKLDRIHIGPGATVGDSAVLFYGAHIGERARVDPHSVVMKRDLLKAGVRYQGCPTRPV